MASAPAATASRDINFDASAGFSVEKLFEDVSIFSIFMVARSFFMLLNSASMHGDILFFQKSVKHKFEPQALVSCHFYIPYPATCEPACGLEFRACEEPVKTLLLILITHH